MRDQRNQRALTLAHRLEAIIAANITNGVRQLETERVAACVGPAKGESAGTRGSGTTSTTERNANESYRLGVLIDNLKDALDGVEIAVGHLDKLALEACRTRAFNESCLDEVEKVAVCRDLQFGRVGVIEWGDPLCLLSPVKAGLCRNHYMAWYRYRKAHGVDTDKDFAA